MGLEAGPKGSTVTKRSARRISVTLTEAEHADELTFRAGRRLPVLQGDCP